jgi:hypothetical protein
VIKPTRKTREAHTDGETSGEILRNADTILRDRIDGLIEQFKSSGTNSYSDYKNARRIAATGSLLTSP